MFCSCSFRLARLVDEIVLATGKIENKKNKIKLRHELKIFRIFL
jgi:hypothetical protein